MKELLETMLAASDIRLALIAIVLLAFAISPTGRKMGRSLKMLAAGHAASDPKVTGSGLVLMIEDARAPVPRHWMDVVDQRIDHKMRGLVQTVTSRMEIAEANLESKMEPLGTMDGKLDNLALTVARIEGILETKRR